MISLVLSYYAPQILSARTDGHNDDDDNDHVIR